MSLFFWVTLLHKLKNAMQIILAREYLKDVNISREQLKYLVMEALRGGCQVFNIELFLISVNLHAVYSIAFASKCFKIPVHKFENKSKV